MSASEPLYTAKNTTAAFQLLWSVSLFWKDPGFGDLWLLKLKSQCETAGIRILDHRLSTTTCSLFLVSTRPHLAGTEIV